MRIPNESPSSEVFRVRDLEYFGSGPPNQALVFRFDLENRLGNPVAITWDWARCRMGNTTIARGSYLRPYFTSKGYAVVDTDESGYAELQIPVSHLTLQAVEERRAGGDLDFELSIHLRVNKINEATASDTDPPTLGIPWEVILAESEHDSTIEGTIPQSRWLEILESLGWEETLLVEIPARRLQHRSPQALRHYKSALEHHRRGDWRKCLSGCRDVLEALAWKHSENDAEKADLTALRNYFPDDKRGDTLDKTLLEFGQFLHFGRHVQNLESDLDIGRADSVLALNVTAGVLRYISE